MSIKMKKEELELISNKDIAAMILEDSKRTLNTADIFKKIIKLLELPESTFEAKIADFYTALSTDKRFIILDGGFCDLKINHSTKVIIDDYDEDFEITTEDDTDDSQLNNEDSYDDESLDDLDNDDDLDDLVIIDDSEENDGDML